MPEKTQKRKLRKDPASDHEMGETASSIAEENPCLSEQGFEDITNNLENRMSKRLRGTERSQMEILRLINLSSKVGYVALIPESPLKEDCQTCHASSNIDRLLVLILD